VIVYVTVLDLWVVLFRTHSMPLSCLLSWTTPFRHVSNTRTKRSNTRIRLITTRSSWDFAPHSTTGRHKFENSVQKTIGCVQTSDKTCVLTFTQICPGKSLDFTIEMGNPTGEEIGVPSS
jgi:hypothetical protein